MAAKVAQVLTGETNIFYGKDLKVASGQTTIEPGILVTIDSGGSTVSASGSTAATRPFGMAFGYRRQPYTPTTKIFAAGEPLAVAKGHFLALLSADFFDGGSLPSTVYQQLYGGMSGKWSVNVGAVTIGRYVRTLQRRESTNGLGTLQDVALVEANIEP
jgi:hypothetical protein